MQVILEGSVGSSDYCLVCVEEKVFREWLGRTATCHSGKRPPRSKMRRDAKPSDGQYFTRPSVDLHTPCRAARQHYESSVCLAVQ